jgi:hypothetical protein
MQCFYLRGDPDFGPIDPVESGIQSISAAMLLSTGIYFLLQNVLISVGRLRSPFGRSLGQPVRLYGGQSERKALGTALIPPPHRQSISERKDGVAK